MARIRQKPQHAPLHHRALARAVRHALALGLAMAASAPVLAGTCDVSDPAAASCDGIFSGINISYAIEDLSLVVGADDATTIDPAAGLAGIELSASYGSIALVNYADISTQDAAGIRVQTYSGDITLANDGTIEADGGNGIQASSYYGDIAIENFGLVDASVVYYGNATGIAASDFFGEVSIYVGADAIVSASSDDVYGGTASGVRASSVLGAATVDNLGSISASAQADYGNATAYGVLDRGGYYGITSVDNAGTIEAHAVTGSGVGWAWGVRERGRYAELDNSGLVSADAYAGSGYASASAAYVRGSTASIDNSGSIAAHAIVAGDGQALAYGTMTWGYDASELENSGHVAAYAEVGSGTSVAMGGNSYYDRALSVYNTGSFLADSYAGLGFAEAVGVAGYAQERSTLVNAAGGEIHAVSGVGNGYAFAYGILFAAGDYARLDNAGAIVAEASAYDSGAFQQAGGLARTIGASLVSSHGDALLYNGEGASISATSRVYGEYGRAYAFGAVAQGSNQARLVNAGAIVADAYSIDGAATALGDLAYGTFAVNLNYGQVAASAEVAGAGLAMAIGQYSFGQVATVVNEGESSASAQVGDGAAYAIAVRLRGGYVAAYNYLQLSATAEAGDGIASALGVDAYGFYGASAYNGGDIDAQALVDSGQAQAVGIYAYAYVYGAYVDNAGSISAGAQAGAGTASATGVAAISYFYGPAQVDNAGSISASAGADGYATATGISLALYAGYAFVHSHGNVAATALSAGDSYGAAEATGLQVDTLSGKYGFVVADIDNDGDITATATREGAYGYARATGVSIDAMYASLYNGGEFAAMAYAQGEGAGAGAVGVIASAKYGVDAVNASGIHATASADGGGSATAAGFMASAYYGAIHLYNGGEIVAEATTSGGAYGADAYANGVNLHGGYAIALDNAGTILALAYASGGAEAVGFSGSAKYDVATVDNHGDILAYAEGYYASALGSRASSKYGALTSNAGRIVARAQGEGEGEARATGSISFAPGAHGYIADASGATLYNAGSILAYASAQGGQAVAIGSRVEGAQDAGAYTANEGGIFASAQSESGAAFATGSNTWSYYGDVVLVNGGDIGAEAIGGASAVAVGAQVRAQGFGPPGYPAGVASLYNAGTIAASALSSAGGAYAIAVNAIGEQGVLVDNAGSILAYAAGATISQAIGVYLYSQATNVLRNYGEILAADIAVLSSELAVAQIDNHGDIAGSILTGALDDSLVNQAGASLWLGNDRIDLGAWSDAGNAFLNAGRIVVRGDGNAIAMGGSEGALLAGTNPLAFVNDGIIDFVDGAADDALLLSGDLAGHGRIAADLDPALGSADRLFVDGNVAADAVQVIDVFLGAMPTDSSTALTVVSVSGDSVAGNFQLGEVHRAVDPGFLTLDLSLQADIDASNLREDAFRIEVEVSGLSDAGILAAAIPSAVQRLLASQAGGERLRSGDDAGVPGTYLWGRVFHSKATLDPGHDALDFGQGGHFSFEQRGAGFEAGLDFVPDAPWRLGVLLFDLRGSQRLHAPGAATGYIDGEGYGVHGAWAAPGGLRIEGAWRHLRFDADVATGTGNGHADSLDLQAARAWTLHGVVELEPQLQFTHTRVSRIEGLSVGATDWQSGASDSNLARAALAIRKRFGDDGRHWTPYASVGALHEFDGESSFRINSNFSGRQSMQGSSAQLEAGLDAEFGALSVSGSLRWQDGGAVENALDAQLSLRYRW
jgi:outer membrane autotransporter protein